ncbi:MFS transporter [Pediococcus pentosaceus]|uniref:MFS transporter n=1 Tax=Pediococcus pentosaceus TaxID=1255 RepID=UPI004039A174
MLVGLFFSNIATNSVQFIISLYILDQTGSTSLFANIMAIALISKIIYTPLSGNLIDRYSKRILMVVLDSMYLICTLILILAVHHSAICSVLIYNIIIGAISSAETPLMQASVPLLVEKQDLMVMNGLVSQMTVLSGILAPMIAGVAYQVFSFTTILLLSSLFFIIAIISEITLKIPMIDQEIKSSLANLKNVLTFLVSTGKKTGKLALLAGVINFIVTAFVEVAVPVLFRLKYHVASNIFGLIQAGLAFGILLAAMLTPLIVKKIKLNNVYILMMVSTGLLLITGLAMLYLNSQLLIISCIILSFVLVQFVFTVVSIAILSEIQGGVEPNMLGSVLAIVMLISMVALPLGEVFYGQVLAIVENNQDEGIVFIAISSVSMLVAWISRKFFK